ncbi:MAG: ribbon-helix-helix protein, CopG family [Alphaproteobacteria bacterium]|nr:ribbon-helix-helix protein, CopG family [Alphaproteobacteria bacterium]MBQ7285209.1 ribbon-helix-helix protein, CopG family [Alphaproteobacteria bacterium]
MSNISVSVSDSLNAKLALVAQKSGKSVDECIALAIRDYIENYEDVYKTDICAVDNLERSFFLSIGE